jgi:hypothetical protein
MENSHNCPTKQKQFQFKILPTQIFVNALPYLFFLLFKPNWTIILIASSSTSFKIKN